jgi:hypothetical protein
MGGVFPFCTEVAFEEMQYNFFWPTLLIISNHLHIFVPKDGKGSLFERASSVMSTSFLYS